MHGTAFGGLLLGLACAVALAQGERPDAPPTPPTPPENIGKPIGKPSAAAFAQLDADRDGRISRREAGASTQLTEQFGQLDSDADGALSRAEYEAFGAPTH